LFVKFFLEKGADVTVSANGKTACDLAQKVSKGHQSGTAIAKAVCTK
jgi:hypothetical protein